MNNEQRIGYVHSLESFGAADGPGVRYMIFLSGCAMRCQFCHNPDTWKVGAGTPYTADALLEQALRYRSYWGSKGGITVSGGEPLMQIDFLLELFQKAKKLDIHTAIDTSGQPYTTEEPFASKWNELMKVTDLVLLDIKQIDNEEHKKLTGFENTNILALARDLSDRNIPVWIRQVLIPGITDDEQDLLLLKRFIHSLNVVKKVEILPYHSLGKYKWETLGFTYPLKDIPDANLM